MVRSTEIESGVRTKRSMAAVSPRWTMMKAPRSTEGWPGRSGEIARIGAIARIADLGKADFFKTGMDGGRRAVTMKTGQNRRRNPFCRRGTDRERWRTFDYN